MWYMKFTKIEPDLQNLLNKLLEQQPVVQKIVNEIAKKGASALLVGGAVRDLFLGLPVKDLDIEVHGITIDQLHQILAEFGPVSLVGKSFGVLRLHGLDPAFAQDELWRTGIDWSLPRTDSSGRHPKVIIDSHMNFADAFKRRDLTINAMGIDLKTFELIDPWHGLRDLKEGILRAPSADLFIEDPLRLFRVMQFVGRFEMKPDNELNKICRTMNLAGISTERIEGEFDKLLLKSKRPSLGIRWLHEIGKLKEILPELASTIGIAQEPSWHPEGDVFEHTMQAIDAAATLDYTDDREKLIALYAVLCHDLGKVTTTEYIDGKLRSYGHEDEGVPLAKKMLKRLTRRVELIDAVAKLVKYHMAPGQFVKNGAKLPAYKRLALKLSPEVSIQLLAKVSLADKRGRNSKSSLPLNSDVPEIKEFLKIAEQAKVVHKPEEPIVHGRDLMAVVQPGPQMGELVKKAYEIQLDEGIHDKQELLKRILN